MTKNTTVEGSPARVRLHIKDLALIYGVTERTIYTYAREGTLPAPRYLPGKPWPFWYQSEIEQNERYKPRLQSKRQKALAASLPQKPQPQKITLF